MYVGEIELTDANVEPLIYLSKKYLMDNLYAQCVAHIKNTLSPNTVWSVLALVDIVEGLEEWSVFKLPGFESLAQ